MAVRDARKRGNSVLTQLNQAIRTIELAALERRVLFCAVVHDEAEDLTGDPDFATPGVTEICARPCWPTGQ